MGRDGTEGARRLVSEGAKIVAQDEATSVVWGMPGHLVRAGLAEDVIPLAAIGPALGRRIAASLRSVPATTSLGLGGVK